MSDPNLGRVPSAPGSREPSPGGLGPTGFDPSREKMIRGLRAIPSDAATVLLNMGHGDYCYVAKAVAQETGIDLRRVRQINRALRALGFADYGPLFDEDSGNPVGSGYWITAAGVFLRDAIEAARDSDGSPEGRDREDGLDGEAATARAAEGGIAKRQPS